MFVPRNLSLHLSDYNYDAILARSKSIHPILSFFCPSVKVTTQGLTDLDHQLIDFFMECPKLYFGHLCSISGKQLTEIFEKIGKGETEIESITVPKFRIMEVDGFLCMRARRYYVEILYTKF